MLWSILVRLPLFGSREPAVAVCVSAGNLSKKKKKSRKEDQPI